MSTKTVIVVGKKKITRSNRFLEKNFVYDCYGNNVCTLTVRYPLLVYSGLPDKNQRMWILSPEAQPLQSLTQWEYCKIVYDQYFKNKIEFYRHFPADQVEDNLTKGYLEYEKGHQNGKLPTIVELYKLSSEFFWQLPIELKGLPA